MKSNVSSDMEVLAFYQYENENFLYDECGFPVFDIFDYISPVQLSQFRKNKETMIMPGKNGMLIELHWPDPDDLEY